MSKLFWIGIAFIGGGSMILIAEMMVNGSAPMSNLLTKVAVGSILCGGILCVVNGIIPHEENTL